LSAPRPLASLWPVSSDNNGPGTARRLLRLRPLREADELPFAAAHAALAGEGFHFGLDGYQAGCSWPGYLGRVRDGQAGINLPAGRVPATFLVADVAGQIVGRISIRHELNEFLRQQGGHIGYAVLPAHRGRGYATEMLRQGLLIARSLGVDRVLVTCDDDNVASRKVIERCGGKLNSTGIAHDGSTLIRRYWID
jgi:predicted acetyltransferase